MTERPPARVRIGIHCLCTNPDYAGGTNSFTFGLLDGFARLGAPHDFKIFVTPWNKHLFERYRDVAGFEVIEVDEADRSVLRRIERRLPPRLGRFVPRRSPATVRRARHAQAIEREADVLYVPYVSPADYFPFPDVPAVFSIHDIQHVHFPEFFTAEELRERACGFARAVAHATVVQASSHAMQREFCDHFPRLNESNVEVIPEGVDVALFSESRPNDVVARHGLPEAFLFTPAQLWHHKNHATILDALRRLRERDLVLPWVLTGGAYNAEGGFFDAVRKLGLEEQIFHLGAVPFEDVIGLHQRARLLVTASLYESSSLTVLEAAAAGTPVVASRIPPHEEMAQTLELRLFAATDAEEAASVLAEAWADDETNAEQVAANRAAVVGCSWDNAARMYVQLLERIRR